MEKEEKSVPTLRSINVPTFYANNVAIGLSLTDVQILGNLNGDPACQLIIPLSAAKSLLVNLGNAITDYEKKRGITIPTLSEISQSLKNENAK